MSPAKKIIYNEVCSDPVFYLSCFLIKTASKFISYPSFSFVVLYFLSFLLNENDLMNMAMNMQKKEFRYVQFPLYLLRGLYINKDKAIEEIFDAGVYLYREKMDKSTFKALKETIKDYFEGKLPEDLNDALKTQIDNGSLLLPEYQEGIKWNPNQVFDKELLVFLIDKHEDLERLALEYYQVVEALKYLDPKGELNSSVERVLINERRINQSIPEKEPKPMIKVDHLVSFYKRNVDELELVTLTAYIGIKSILGSEEAFKTNKDLILARMFGFKDKNSIPEELPEQIRLLYDKYKTRRKMDKLLNEELEAKWHLKFYSRFIRGIWVGSEKISYDKLILDAEKKKKNQKLKDINKQKQKAIANAKNVLNRNND